MTTPQHVLVDDVLLGSQLLTAGSPIGADQVIPLRAAGALIVDQGTGPHDFSACFAAMADAERLKRRGDSPAASLRMMRAYSESVHAQVLGTAASFRAGVTVDEMVQLGVELGEGAMVMTEYPRAGRWYLSKASTVTADGITVLADAGGGRWFRDIVSGAPGAIYAGVWLVDSAAGDNGNDGVTAPVKDLEEVSARIGQQMLRSTTYIFVTGDFSTRSYTFDFNLGLGVPLGIIGSRSAPVLTVTVSAVSAADPASGTPSTITCQGAPDLRAYEHQWIRDSTSPRDGWKTAIKGSQAQLQAGIFFGNPGDQSNTAIAPEFVVNDSLGVYTVSKVGGDVSVVARGYGSVIFQTLDIGTPGSNHSTQCMVGAIGFIACTVRGLDWHPLSYNGFCNTCQTFDMRTYASFYSYSSIHDTVGGAAFAARGNAVVQIAQRTLVLGTFSLGHDLGVNQPAETGAATVNVQAPLMIVVSGTSVADGLLMYSGRNSIRANAQITVKNSTTGTPLTNGYRMQAGTGIFWATGKAPTSYPANGNVGAATNDFKIGGTAKTAAQVAAADFAATNGAVIAVVAVGS